MGSVRHQEFRRWPSDAVCSSDIQRRARRRGEARSRACPGEGAGRARATRTAPGTPRRQPRGLRPDNVQGLVVVANRGRDAAKRPAAHGPDALYKEPCGPAAEFGPMSDPTPCSRAASASGTLTPQLLVRVLSKGGETAGSADGQETRPEPDARRQKGAERAPAARPRTLTCGWGPHTYRATLCLERDQKSRDPQGRENSGDPAGRDGVACASTTTTAGAQRQAHVGYAHASLTALPKTGWAASRVTESSSLSESLADRAQTSTLCPL